MYICECSVRQTYGEANVRGTKLSRAGAAATNGGEDDKLSARTPCAGPRAFVRDTYVRVCL